MQHLGVWRRGEGGVVKGLPARRGPPRGSSPESPAQHPARGGARAAPPQLTARPRQARCSCAAAPAGPITMGFGSRTNALNLDWQGLLSRPVLLALPLPEPTRSVVQSATPLTQQVCTRCHLNSLTGRIVGIHPGCSTTPLTVCTQPSAGCAPRSGPRPGWAGRPRWRRPPPAAPDKSAPRPAPPHGRRPAAPPRAPPLPRPAAARRTPSAPGLARRHLSSSRLFNIACPKQTTQHACLQPVDATLKPLLANNFLMQDTQWLHMGCLHRRAPQPVNENGTEHVPCP